jgi:hypothetical protein
MMPILLDVQQRYLTTKSRSENARDVERCLAAVDKAAAEHNRVLELHHPGIGDEFKTKPAIHELADGVLLVAFVIQTKLINTKKDPDDNAYDVADCLQAAVHALAECNLILLEHHPWLPDLYDSGVRYITDPLAWKFQTLKSIPTIKQQGGSDCKCLTGWRLAHKWRAEQKPKPYGFGKRLSRCKIYWRIIPPERMRNMLPEDILKRVPADGMIAPGRLFHALMRSPDGPNGYTNPDGDVEDMSRYLGM